MGLFSVVLLLCMKCYVTKCLNFSVWMDSEVYEERLYV